MANQYLENIRLYLYKSVNDIRDSDTFTVCAKWANTKTGLILSESTADYKEFFFLKRADEKRCQGFLDPVSVCKGVVAYTLYQMVINAKGGFIQSYLDATVQEVRDTCDYDNLHDKQEYAKALTSQIELEMKNISSADIYTFIDEEDVNKLKRYCAEYVKRLNDTLLQVLPSMELDDAQLEFIKSIHDVAYRYNVIQCNQEEFLTYVKTYNFAPMVIKGNKVNIRRAIRQLSTGLPKDWYNRTLSSIGAVPSDCTKGNANSAFEAELSMIYRKTPK